MSMGLRSALSDRSETATAAEDILGQLVGFEASAVVFFASARLDGAALSRALRERFPAAEVIGCTTAGEFNSERTVVGGVSVLAFGPDKARRAAATLARFEGGVAAGVRAAATRISEALGIDLRTADPDRFVGLVLVEGLGMKEEAANEALGNVAPLLSFVGASAGDDLEFKVTRVYHNGEQCTDGAALLLLDMAVPFVVEKTCSFRPTSRKWKVTRADEDHRVVYELDGAPVLSAYAEAVGTTPDRLDDSVFMVHPVGLMIDGAPWIRSPQRALADGGLKFYCRIAEGMEIHLMQSTDIIEESRAAFAKAEAELGQPIAGGLGFNCILRRREMDARGLHEPFLEIFRGRQVAGFHTYGESWLGHMNQTFTALWVA